MAAFEPEQYRDLARGSRRLDLRTRNTEHHLVGVKLELSEDRFEQIPRPVGSGRAGNFHRHPEREENRSDAAFPQPRNINAAFSVALLQIESIKKNPLGRIRVGIDDQA